MGICGKFFPSFFEKYNLKSFLSLSKVPSIPQIFKHFAASEHRSDFSKVTFFPYHVIHDESIDVFLRSFFELRFFIPKCGLFIYLLP